MTTTAPPKKARAPRQVGPDAAALTRFEQSFGKTFGEDVLRRTDRVRQDYEVISTGSITLDFATGVGGYVEGRVYEIWGPESIGKTFLALLGVIEAQKKHPTKMVFFIDMEQTLDIGFAQRLGVDLSRMYHVQPDSAEDVADIMKSALDSSLISMVIVDSIGGMVTEEEFEKEAEKDVVGTSAKVITRMVKIAAVQARRTGAVVIVINQVRAIIGPRPGNTTGGGFALKHATTMKFKMARTATMPFVVGGQSDKMVVGFEVSVQVEKNKVAPPKRTAIFAMCNQGTDKYGPIGVDRAGETATMAVVLGIVRRRGSAYDMPVEGSDEPVTFKGIDAVKDHLHENPDAVDYLRQKIIAERAHEVVPDVVDAADVPEGLVDTTTGEVLA